VLEAIPYQDGQAAEWDAFVEKSPNHTLFNLRRFLAYHAPDRFRDASFWLAHKGNPVAAVPAAMVGDRWVSHGGATYGGFVLGGRRIAYDYCRDVVAASIGHAKGLGAKSMTVTLPPSFYRAVPHDYLEAAMQFQGFRFLKRDITSACGNLHPGFLDDWVNKARSATRHAMAAGLEIIACPRPSPAELDVFHRILAINRESIGAYVTHSRADLDALYRQVPERLDLYLARHQGVDVACGLVFRVNARVDLIFYVAHLREHQHLKPIHLLVHRMFAEAARRGVAWIDYGISTINNKLTNDGLLLAFKENFNMQGFFRDTFTLDL
jgi:hypothetical protein